MPSRRSQKKKLKAKEKKRSAQAAAAGGADGEKRRAAQALAKAQSFASDELDDWTAAWVACKDGDGVWGGRGRGGRGIQRRSIYGKVGDIIVEGVTLAFAATSLLERSRLMLCKNRRYALIGDNGCGKSTLLNRMARGMLPGFPLSVRCGYVEQELPSSDLTNTRNTLQELTLFILDQSKNAGAEAKALVEEMNELESMMNEDTNQFNDNDGDDQSSDDIVQRLCEITGRLEELGFDEQGNPLRQKEIDAEEETAAAEAEKRARDVLTYIGFSNKHIEQKCSMLSGGMRMRLALAKAMIPNPDLLLLDEPTNHLDIVGVLWLEQFLRRSCGSDKSSSSSTSSKSGKRGKGRLGSNIKSVLFVSHDHAFLEAVATDIIVFERKQLTYHPCGYEEYLEMTQQKQLHLSRKLEHRNKKEGEAKAFIQKQQQIAQSASKSSKGHGVDPNKQKQAKMKAKKAERAALFRSDGKRYKKMSLKKLDAKHDMRPEVVGEVGGMGLKPKTVHELKKEQQLKFKFPGVDVTDLRLSSKSTPVLSIEGVTLGYPINVKVGSEDKKATKVVLRDVNVEMRLNSRVAIVGPNGAGKSTLLKLIMGELEKHGSGGSIERNRNLRIAYVSQHHVEALEEHLDKTAVDMLQAWYSNVSALSARSHLGAFGLAGKLALSKIKSLSGGQRARLALSLVTWTKPHVLVLDEPTNHLDMRSLDALADALQNFEGGVLLVSHNQHFLHQICRELWWVQGGKVRVRRVVGDGEEGRRNFGDLFKLFLDAFVAQS